MGCVNTNSKEFKDTAKRLNVHPSALEGVVHEFINTKGNEELFPSDDYIQKRLKGEAVKISAEDLELCTLKGWRNTQYFGNYNAMINQMTEMQKFLPEGMVIGGRDHDGNYTISLAPLVLDGVKLTPIRQEYQGKLIYSQSKSGKSTIADGKTVIDLDTYKDFYGDKVHLTALNPDEVFKALDEGKTILTSDPTLLNWADVIVYSSNLNDIVERTKETTPFDSPESYQGEIDNINETINSRRGDVEVIKLSGKDDVLGKHILSDPNYKQTTKGKETTYSTEEKKILKSAPRNTEGKLLAPNGEVSNLTEKQYAQVRTKAFKEWFGDWENNPKEASKVVDQNGEPLVVYHGTPFNFTTFKKGTESYFTNDKKSARFYSTDIMDTDAGDALGMTPKDARLMPVFLNIKNPYRNEKGLIRDSQIPKHIKENQDGAIVKAIGFPHTLEIEKALVAEIKTLQKQYPELSYDEVLEKVTYKGEVQYVIKDPNQAKSATENTGEFSTLDNDIYADGLFSPRDFDRETPAPKSIKRERLQKKWKAEWDAIKTNDWNLPKTIQERVEKKLKEYEESQYGYYKGEVDTTNYFGKENKTTAKSVLEYIAKNSTDSTTRKLAARLLKNLGNNEEVPVTFGFAYGAKGIYNATEHSVAISKDALKGKTLEEALVSMEGTIIHEIAHAITVNTMIKDSNSTKDLDVIYKEYKELGTKYGLDLGYGAKNQEEFVAEFLGNKFFREVLMALPSNTNKKVSIGRKILNFILEKVFGITPKDTFFHRADKVVQQLLDRANSREITEINNTETYAQEDIEKKFTFNDGTTVDAPFQPNAQQTAALNAMGDFIKSDKNVMTLSGYAGTGKTSLMEMIAKKCRQEDQNVIFCASTNKAAAVLNDKVSRSHFEAKTLHKIFGISVSTDMDNSHYDSSKLKSSLKGEDELVYGSTVIIDEASMINEKTYNIIKNKAEKNNCKIIFVGDEAQLAPVNEDKISVVFRQNDGKVERLTQVERTGDNAILKEATAIRDGKPLSGKTSFNDKGEGVAYITPQNTKAIDAVINAFIPGLQNDADHFRILAYTNEAVANYNDRVRRALGYTGTIPRVGEPMMGYDNWGYDKRTKSYDLTNSESYKVTKIGNTETVSKRLDSGETIEFQVTYITLENSLGEKKSFPFIDVKGNAHNRESAEKAAREVAELYKQQANTHDKNKRKECFKKINALREFLFINDNILDGNSGRKLASKVIDFGYAMTIHKSQGSTFKNVLLDDANIKDNMATSEEKQQLEYVGVSRATDTVTVISNNVKKEGTPMQYSKGTPTIDTTDTRTQESPERKVTIPPTIDGKVQPKETFSIKVDNGIHIYNSRGEEVFNRGTEEDTRNRNKVITNYRFQEGSAVRVQLINKEGKPVLTEKGEPEEVAVYKDGTMISIVASPGEELFATTKAKALSNYQATLRLAEQKFNEKDPSRIPSTVYHYSDSEITKFTSQEDNYFSRVKGGTKNAIFFTDNPNPSKGTVLDRSNKYAVSLNVAPDKVKVVYGTKEDMHARGTTFTEEVNKAEKEGYEAVRFIGINDNQETNQNITVIFDPNKAIIQGKEDRNIITSSTSKKYNYTTGVTKIISGAQTGVDTIGLQVGKELGLETGGTAPKRFLREQSVDNEDVASYGVVEISDEVQADYTKRTGKRDPYTARTEQNVRNSDGTVYFSTDADSAGKWATKRAATQWNKPFLENPTATQLRQWLIDNNIKTLNVAGNRGSKLPANNKVAKILKEALAVDIETITPYQNLYSEDGGKTPIVMYRGYALSEDREATTIHETVGYRGVDYNKTLKGSIYFTSDITEAEDYGKIHTNPFTEIFKDGKWVKIKDPGYRGPYAKVGKYYISSNAKVEHFKNIEDYASKVRHGYTSTADVIVLDHGTADRNATEYIVKNPGVIISNNELNESFIEAITPSFKGKMTYAFSGESRQGVKSATTIEAIKNRERTATTRYSSDGNIAYWSRAKKGDVIEFTGANGETALVEVTVPLHKLDANTTASEWSKKEGWNEKRFNDKVKPRIDKGEAYQMEFRYIGSKDKESTPIDTRTQEGLEKATRNHKQLVVDMGNDANATQGIRTAIAGAKKGITLEEALGSHQPFFTQEEIAQIEASIPNRRIIYYGNTITGRLEIMSVSRRTDPIFFADDIVEFLKENGKKPLTDPTRTVAMEIWSKHDGLPLRRIMEACKKYRVAPMLSFSITGLGGTALEKGVMKYNDMLDKIQTLIKSGVIDPTTTTIRIDPILVGETKLEDIKAIVERAKGMGIKKFVTSLVQSYGYTEGTSNDRHVISGINDSLATEGRKYEWDKYYGRNKYGKINFTPKQEYIDEVAKFLVELNKDPNIEIQSCAFPIKGLKTSACLDPYIIQSVTGINIMDSYIKDEARPGCDCYGVHQDFFKNDKTCNSSCAYCYAKHSGDNNMRYYDNNGKLVDNVFTRTSEGQSTAQTTQTSQENKPKQDKSITKKENKNFMEKSSRISTMRNNLNNSSLLKASEVRKIGEKVVDWISDHITSLQQNPEEIARVYGEQFKDIDISSMSRAELVNKIGIENIFQAAKDKLNSEQYEDWTDDVASKADELYDNFDALIYMAHDRFAENEGFSISLSTDGNQYEVNTEINEDADNFNASNKESDTSEIEKDQQEHWQVETKTRDVIDSMNKLVKDTLRKCLVLDSKGEPVRDDFGFNEKVDIREAVNFIYNTTKGSLTLGNMISKLKEKVEEYPWLTQLLEKLEDTTGEYNDLQSQFFGDMFKPFQSYHVVIKEGGKFKSIPVNENPVLQESLNSVKSLYYIGEHPLFITQSEVNHKTFDQLKERVKALNDYTDVTDSNVKGTVAGIISEISQCLGYSVTPEIVATGLTKESLVSSKAALANIIEALEKLDSTSVREKVNYDAFSFKNDISIRGNLKTFLSPIVQHFEDIAMASTYDDGKMYQSYVTPSYLSKLMIKFATTDEAAFKDFIQSEYGQYSWFWDSTNNSWNNDWLEQLDKNPEARKIFKHKVQLNFDGKHYMKGMSDAEYALSVFTEYFGDGATGSEKTPAWFRIPMQSNKPSSEFIRFYSDRSSYYKSNLTNKLFKVFCQELSRIQTVTERNLGKSDKGFIANFDKNGNRFHFLEYMNKYLDGELKNTELGQLLRKKLAGEDISQDMAHFADLVKEAIRNEMDAKVASIVDGMYESGIAQAAADNLPGFSEEVTREKLENFVWNDTFAAINILQLTVTDIAFYKNAEDLQKRLAEIHAPGIRGRVDATDYNGRKVSDGKYRAIKLADFNKVISNIIDNLTIVFDRKIANAKTETERRGYEVLKDSLVGEKGLYRDINVTDAQAYNCPTSYRKKAIMFGKWSKDAEKIWETLASGKANLSDIKVAFQPLKPTVFSHAVKNVGTKNSTMNNLKVPIYYKNSEYLLIMADAILRGENTGKPNLLRALFDVMEESHFTTDKNGKRVYKTDGIDTIIFESGVKSGLGGQVSLNDLVYSANGEALAKERLEASIYNSDGRYNTDTVDVMAFEDYCLQQEVPEHFKDHAQVFGSQLRYIGISELESIDATGEAVKYHIGKDAEGKTAQELKEEYENLIAQNIQESMDELYEELCVGEDFSLKEKNAALSKILQREILASPRYGIDLLQACSINENGDFNIPLGDPIQSKRVQQLINSIVKNRINKQKIAGGPVVQVTSFGTSTELGIKFKDGKGGLLLTRKEWENSSSKEHTTYDDYIKENQKGIAYMEVLAPAYASDILRKFTGSDGVVNVKALEMLDPELLEMIGYRIPTEEKYSAAPLKIVGFLPREAGEGIMLPYDITLINGSDYDVDKEYIMRKVLNIKVKPEYANKEGNINKTNMSQILWNDLIKSQAKEGKEKNLGQHQKTQLSNLVKLFLDDPFNEAALTAPVTSKDQISMTKGAYNRMLRTYLNAYEVEHPGLDTKEGRDNRIIDILNSVLTHETSTDKVLNPGGFEEQKKMGYLVEAIRNNPELTSIHTWEELENMSIDELKELSSKDKNLCYIDTQFQFYKQNSAAGSLIGIFAVNRTAHAAIESGSVDGSATYFIDGRQLEDKDGFENVSIDGVSLGTKNNYEVRFDMRLDINGMPIGKTLGSLVGASADAVKDPVLNLMNINSDTANVLNALLRVGVPFRTAALFLSQGSISRLISRLNMQRLSDGYGSLSDIALERFKELNDQYKLSKGDINSEDLSIEDLIDGIKGPKNSTDAEQNKQAAIEYKVLKTLIRSLNIADALRLPTFATRFNSITSAVGPLVIDNLITEMQGKDLNANSFIRTKENGKVINVEVHDILNSHPILNGFAHGLVVARRLFSNNSPLNSTNFRGVLEWVSGNFPSLKAALISSSGRTLFNTLGNIYQTMLLYKTGVLKSEELGYFINDFPKEFMKKDYKNDPRFKDNELIKMIRYTSVKNDNSKSALSINTTSLDTAHKEKLSNALIDLYKTDQEGAELAIKLFKYNVFKGGIDFSPKTFTHLFPSFIKERIPGETSESGYIDTFRKLPELEPATVIDMLVRNNYDNNRLAPVFKDKAAEVEKANKNSDTEVDVSGPRILDGVLERFSNGNKQVTLSLEDGQGKSLIHTPYFKMYDKEGNIRLFSTDVNVNNIGKPESVTVTEISKLGNGKEYMELYNETNHEALSERESNIIDESPNDITSVQDGSMDTMLNHSVDGRKISSAELIQEALKYSSQVQEEARTEGVSAEQKVKDNYIRMSKEASKDANQVDKLINFVTSKLKDKGFDISKSKLREDIEKFKEDQNIC